MLCSCIYSLSLESECKCLTCNQKPTGSQFSLLHSDVNKDLTFKDKDQTLKAKDQDKDQTYKDKTPQDKDQTFKAKDQDKD